MRSSLGIAAALFAATFTLSATPAAAQRSVYDMGGYWAVGMVTVEDGQFENYMDYLNTGWKQQQDWMKSKGYSSDYFVLLNQDRRADEPDLYLVTVFPTIPTPAQEKKMNDEYVALMGKDEHVMDNESGVRVKMRTLSGQMLMRQLMLKKTAK